MAQTKVSFDAATLADAVQKAARIAPSKGAAYDKAAGIMFKIDTVESKAIVEATNLDTTYRQVLTVQDAKGEPTARWRIPSGLIAGLVSNLPLGSGSLVSFIDPGDGAIRIKCGNMAVSFNMINEDAEHIFPIIETFPDAGLGEANDFAQKVAAVSWACAKDGSLMSGVHIDGESLVGCNRDVAAMVPCKVPVDRPVTVPLFTIATILRNATDVRVAAGEKKLHMSLDAETQATSTLFEGAYPNVKALRRDTYTGEIKFSRTAFVESAKRLLVVAQAERLPTMKLTLNPGLVRTLTLDLAVPGTGRIQDTIDVQGDFEDPFEIWFTPGLIVPAVENAKEEVLTFKFGHAEPARASMSIVTILDNSGYETLVMPRKP